MGKKYNHAAMRTPDPDNYAEFLAYYMAMPRDRKLMIYGQVILANEFARDGTIAAQPAAQ